MDKVNTGGLVHKLAESRVAKGISLITALLAVLSFPFAFDPIQQAVFEKRTDFALELQSEIPIFDINRPLEGLSVTFQGRDLTALQQGVVVAQVQLRNVGDVSITPNKTTNLDPLGFRLDGGSLVRVTRVSASSEHLREHVAPRRQGNQITLNQGLIFEPGDYVRFDLLVTKPLKSAVQYHPLGKIEGVRAIGFRTPSSLGSSQSAAERAFRGDSFVQVLRLVVYTIASIMILALIIVVSQQLSDLNSARRARKRRRLANLTVDSLSLSANLAIHAVLSSLYAARGMRGLRALDRHLKRIKDFPNAYVDSAASQETIFHWRLSGEESRAIQKLELLGLADQRHGSVDPNVGIALAEFRDALKESAAILGTTLRSIEPPPRFIDDISSSDDTTFSGYVDDATEPESERNPED